MRTHTWHLCILYALLCNISFVYSIDNIIIIDDISVTDEICDLENGTLTITINNPTSGLEYSVDAGATYQDSNYFDNLPSGDYLVIVRDATSCSNAFSIQIVDAPFPKVTTEFYCVPHVNKVDINLTPFPDGILPFTYRWEGPNNNSYDSKNLRSVDPGEYSVTVTDRLGCQIDTTIFLPNCCEMSVSCNNMDTTRISCLKDLPHINSAFLDNVSNGDEDLNEILNLGVSIDDRCSDINISVSDNYDSNHDCNNGSLEYKRVYTINDGVSSSNCERIILVDHYNDIIFQKPAEDLSVTCDDNIEPRLKAWVDNMAGAIVETCSSNYTVRTVPDIYDIEYSCLGTGSLEVQFIINDECDNELTFTSKFIVDDITPPNIICPEMLEIDAEQVDFEQQVGAWLDSYDSEDNCSSVSVSHDYNIGNLTYECTEESLDVQFFTIDDCGNQNTCTTTIVISQIFIPTIDCPEALVIQCAGVNNKFIIDDWLGLAAAVGYSNAPIAISNDLNIQELDNYICLAPVPVTFYADRACLQDVECTTTIEIVDAVAPAITCPPSLVIDNGEVDYENKITDWLSGALATDNCSQALLSNNFIISDLDFCNNDGDIEVGFTAIDDCNNISTCESIIELTPYSFSINCPEDIIIECSEDIEPIIEDWLLEGLGIENFTDSLVLNNDFITSNLDTDCDGITQVNFSTDNDCQGTLSCASAIQIVDTVKPIITCPQALTVDIESVTRAEEISSFLDSATAIDDCHDVIINSDMQSISDIECTEDFEILFTATDECDNVSECLSQLTLVNSTSPEIVCPDTFTAYCDDRSLDNNIMQHLSNVEVVSSIDYNIYNDLVLGDIDRDCEQDYMTDVLIDVIDDCGNENSCSTTLHIFPPPRVYIPNIFTPESNTSDEIFTVFSNNSVVEVLSLRIYDRWGSLICERENFPPNDKNYGWYGIFNNAIEKSNVVTYHIVVKGILGDKLEFAGTIQVMK